MAQQREATILPGPQMRPYYNADPYVDGRPGRRRGITAKWRREGLTRRTGRQRRVSMRKPRSTRRSVARQLSAAGDGEIQFQA